MRSFLLQLLLTALGGIIYTDHLVARSRTIAITYYLVRHAQTDWLPGDPAHNRYQSRTDVPLSEHGRQQARELAGRLRDVPFLAAFASDLSRGAETARLMLDGREVPLVLDPDLREIDVGEWEGLTGEQVLARYPALAAQRHVYPLRFAPPGGEAIGDAAKRFRRLLATASNSGRDGNVLLVSHQNALRVLRALLLRLPLNYHRRFRVDPASLSIVQTDGQFGSLVLLNDTSHLGKRP
jgi:broad specificity phosphatase PhoE